ncbi:MAG: CPBP family intramembrane metalloprotease [Acidobacteria bacterium]|nr:CPBP family intramembrane metalloprotease [Acidobacteriota bacterium]
MERRDGEPVWSYEDLGILLGAVLPCLVFAAISAKGLSYLVPQKGVVAALSQMLIYIGVAGSLYFMLQARYGLEFWAAMDWRVPWRRMMLTGLIGPALAIGMSILAFFLGIRREPFPIDSLMTDRASVLAIGFAATTIGPVFEELIFRGFVQPLFVHSLGLVGGLLATAMPFALLHGPQYNWNWQLLVILTIASVVFGIVRHVTGSTAASSLTHAAYNLTFMLGMILKETN